jgi:hypothetical protein
MLLLQHTHVHGTVERRMLARSCFYLLLENMLGVIGKLFTRLSKPHMLACQLQLPPSAPQHPSPAQLITVAVHRHSSLPPVPSRAGQVAHDETLKQPCQWPTPPPKGSIKGSRHHDQAVYRPVATCAAAGCLYMHRPHHGLALTQPLVLRLSSGKLAYS